MAVIINTCRVSLLYPTYELMLDYHIEMVLGIRRGEVSSPSQRLIKVQMGWETQPLRLTIPNLNVRLH